MSHPVPLTSFHSVAARLRGQLCRSMFLWSLAVAMLGCCCSYPRVSAMVAPVPEEERRSPSIALADFTAARPKIVAALTQVLHPETFDDPAATAARGPQTEAAYGPLLNQIADHVPLNVQQLSAKGALAARFENASSEEPIVYRGYDARLIDGTVYGDVLVLVHKEVAFAFYRLNPDEPDASPVGAAAGSLNYLVVYPSKILFDREYK